MSQSDSKNSRHIFTTKVIYVKVSRLILETLKFKFNSAFGNVPACWTQSKVLSSSWIQIFLYVQFNTSFAKTLSLECHYESIKNLKLWHPVLTTLRKNFQLPRKFRTIFKIKMKKNPSVFKNRVPLSSTQTPQFNTSVQHKELFSTQNPSVQQQIPSVQYIWTEEVFVVELRVFWCGSEGFLLLNWGVCGIEGFSVLNWGMCWIEGFSVCNWGLRGTEGCVEMRAFWCGTEGFVELRGFGCGSEGFWGLKKSGPFVSNWFVELRRPPKIWAINDCQ